MIKSNSSKKSVSRFPDWSKFSRSEKFFVFSLEDVTQKSSQKDNIFQLQKWQITKLPLMVWNVVISQLKWYKSLWKYWKKCYCSERWFYNCFCFARLSLFERKLCIDCDRFKNYFKFNIRNSKNITKHFMNYSIDLFYCDVW